MRFYNTPYGKVLESNGLDFGSYPHHATASLLARYGVPQAGRITQAVKDLVDTRDLGAFFEALLAIAEPLDKLPLLLARIWVRGEEPEPQQLALDLNCEYIFYSRDFLEATARQDQETVNQLLENYYFYENLPPIKSWVAQPQQVIAYLIQTESDIVKPAQALLAGELYEFFIATIKLTTNLDLLKRPEELKVLKQTLNASFDIIKPGYGEIT